MDRVGGNQDVAGDFSENGYGLGGFKFDLAPEMFISSETSIAIDFDRWSEFTYFICNTYLSI